MTFDPDAIRQDFADGKGGVLEWIARENGVSTLDIARLLPDDQRVIVADPPMADVLEELAGWGEVMIVKVTPAVVLEIASAIPPALMARGYFNFHGDTAFGGHLKEDACHHLAFLDRRTGERRSLSLVFYDGDGEVIFKVFVRRDENREMLPGQIVKYEALRASMLQVAD